MGQCPASIPAPCVVANDRMGGRGIYLGSFGLALGKWFVMAVDSEDLYRPFADGPIVGFRVALSGPGRISIHYVAVNGGRPGFIPIRLRLVLRLDPACRGGIKSGTKHRFQQRKVAGGTM